MKPRFFDRNLGLTGQLETEEAQHASRVLRLSQGSEIEIIDGQGGLAMAVLIDREGRLEVRSREKFERSGFQLKVAMALTKQSDRVEWVVEKLAEIGVERFIPLISERTERSKIRIDRLERISLSALKQSRSLFMMAVEPAQSLSECLSKHPGGTFLIAHCADGAKQRLNELRAIDSGCLLIGPEGDFSPAEIAQALQLGALEIDLGARRLRTETAALYGASVLLGSRT